MYEDSKEFLLSPHQNDTPKGHCSFSSKEMMGPAARIWFISVTGRCREGQEGRTVSLSHRYIKGVAKLASFIILDLVLNRTVLHGLVFKMLLTT